jgi:spermidine synthase
MHRFAVRVSLLLLASGFCGLVYQMAWLRLLRLVFGASTAASAAVLAIFMGGLGAGSYFLGPRADRTRNPLRLYAHLEIGIAVAAGLTPLLVAGIRALYVSLGGSQGLGDFGGTALRLVLSIVVLGLPAFLMGGTLPATVRAVMRKVDAGRRDVGLLYAVNTLGAVLGALVTTFVAIELLGIRKTIWVAALVNLLVAVVARSMSRTAPPVESTGPLDRAADAAAPEVAGAPGTKRAAPLGLVLAAAALVGFAFFLMELVWYRMLAPILGGTSYTFGLILAVALLGIGLGGLAYSLGSERVRPTLTGFAATCSLEALALAVPFFLGDRLALLSLSLLDLDALGFGGLVLGWSVVTAIVVLPAALVAGYQFPLLVAVLGAGRAGVGREVGLTYTANTAGAIVGSIAGGFGLLPLLSAPGTWRATVLLLVLLALAALAVAALRYGAGQGAGRRAVGPVAGLVAGLAAASVLLVLAHGPTAFWRHSGIGAGRFPEAPEDPNELREAIHRSESIVEWEEDGLESSVALIAGDGYSFIVNGKADGSAIGDAGTQVMSGLVGSMLHERPERALVVGLGTGSTAGWLAQVPTIERVDVVELEPAIVRVAEWCSAVNHDALSDPKVELLLGDGRELLLTTDERYDVIFSEPSNPYRAGISSLYTREFYQAARERLTEGGIFIQFLQGYEVDSSVVRTAYATLGSVFPAVESWQTLPGDLLLVATEEPIVHDLERVRRRAAEEPYRSALPQVWGVSGAEGFYSGFLAAPPLARALAEAARGLNTDDHPIIEFGFVRNLGRQGLFEVGEVLALARQRGEDRPRFRGVGPDWRGVDDARYVRGALYDHVPEPAPGAEAHRRRDLRSRYAEGDWAAIRSGWESETDGPRHRIDLLAYGHALAATGGVAAERIGPVAERLRRVSPAEAEGLLGLAADRRGDARAAIGHFEAALRAARGDPWIQGGAITNWLRASVRLAGRDPAFARRLFELLEEPFAAGLVDQRRKLTRLQLAPLVSPASCVEAWADHEPWVPWADWSLEARLACYDLNDHPLADAARRDLARWRTHQPPRLEEGLEEGLAGAGAAEPGPAPNPVQSPVQGPVPLEVPETDEPGPAATGRPSSGTE